MASASQQQTARTAPGVVMGTMAIGPRCDREEGGRILDVCASQGVLELDTALMYGGGETEVHLGALGAGSQRGFTLATKVNPFKTTPQPVEVGLQPERIHAQFRHSLQSLQLASVDILYLHAPDAEVPIGDSLRAINELHQQGTFRRFGLSNYSAWQVAEIYYLCKLNNYILPTVYQGMYNAVTRQVEAELFPCLRRFGMAFYAYNPLAGGLLTGRYASIDEQPDEGRFNAATMWGKTYKARYWKQELFETLNHLKEVCAKHDIKPADAAHRWMVHHSAMDGSFGDKIILGASSSAHAAENIAACRQGPLPADIVAVLDQGWQAHKANCPNYFR